MLSYNKKLKGHARELRKDMTDAEILLWSKIRLKQLKGYQFYRQKIIGNYIADFYCPKAKLVVELDGGQHCEEAARQKDEKRDCCMRRLGLKVLRFSDTEVLKEIEGVVEKIWEFL